MSKLRSLREVEADRKAEERAARKWYARNAHRLGSEEPEAPRIPGHRRVRTFSNAEYSALLGSELGVVYSEGGRFIPLQGTMPSVGDEENVEQRRALEQRFDTAWDTLAERQQDLLLAHYVEGLTLSELAEHGETRQAVHTRVWWAKLAFRRAYEGNSV